MTEAWQRNRLAGLCSDAKLNDQEQQFLHSIVRLTDTSGVLIDSALAVRTVSFTIPWAASLISIYKQNYIWKIHLENALNSAAAAVKDLKPDPHLLPTASAWNASLSAITASPIDRSIPEIIANAAQVHSHMHEISSLILLGGISHTLSAEVVERYAAEVALGLISQSADAGEMITNLRQLTAHSSTIRIQIVNQLCSPGQYFNVMIPVLGATLFDSIDKIDPSVRIFQLKRGSPGSFASWGTAASGAREFMVAREKAFDQLTTRSTPNQQRAFLSLTVQAPDMKAAAVIARRTITEALDQYIAGHPFVQFDIDELMGVSSPGKSHINAVSIRPPVESNARPLAIPWPITLREAMRISHLLREATAPMTRVALAWVMIESSNLKKEDIDDIAKTLALRILRQRVFISYRLLVQELLAKLYDLLRYKCEQQAATKRRELDRINSVVNPSVVGQYRNAAYLRSEVPWLRLLSADIYKSDKDEVASLRILLDLISLPARLSVEELSRLAKSPTLTADLLTTSRNWWGDVLKAFYAARNIHLHRGVFNSEGDVVLGALAVLVSDSLFETWGTWYSNGANSQLSTKQIINQLAKRYDTCLSELKSGRAVVDIDLDHITSPGWNA